MSRLYLRNEGRYYVVNPALAAEIGINESIILTQIEFLTSISKHEHDGRKWTYQSAQDLVALFPWLSEPTIRRCIKSLEKRKLLLIGNFNERGYDRTRWFAINEEGIAQLSGVALVDERPSDQNDQLDLRPSDQNDQIHVIKLIRPSDQNDQTNTRDLTETTTEKEREKENLSGDKEKPERRIKPKARSAPPVKLNPGAELIAPLIDVLKLDPDLIPTHVQREVRAFAALLATNKGATPGDVARFGSHWYGHDWRGKRGEPPTISQIRTEWGRMAATPGPSSRQHEVDAAERELERILAEREHERNVA